MVNSTNSNITAINELCDPNEKWLIIVPGWRQNCESPWIIDAISSK